MQSLKSTLIGRDGITEEQADEWIAEAKQDLQERLEAGEYPMDICEEWFGLEPDFIMDLIEI